MGKTRLEFQTFLETLKGDRNVYFQAPSSVLMKYPAIRYNLADLNDLPADNIDYQNFTAYMVTYITSNPDDVMIKTLAKLPYSNFNQWYAKDNLNHYVYTIFY
jgi:hypothetical protein